jgi:predicted Zn-dependent peptidase
MIKEEFFKYTLGNGIRCILKRVKSPVAWCAMTVGAGSRDELHGETGAAHFAEHMMFKGTAKRKAYHINNRLENLGGELNAFTTKEETVVHATTLKADFPKAVELIADVLFHSTFPAKEVEREREVILDEINSYKDSPPERIYDEFEDLLFSGSQLGHNILGTKASVGKMSGEDIKNFTLRAYTTDQMVFSVAANISEAVFVRTMERYLGGILPSQRGFTREAPAIVAPFDKTINRNTNQSHCVIGARAYSYKHSNRVALSLLINILGGPAANSRLNTLLREKNGLTYNVEASYLPYGDTGLATVYIGTDKDKTDRCIELSLGLIKQLTDTALTTRGLAAAKKQFIGQLAIASDGTEGYMLSAAKSYLVYDDIDPPSAVYKKIDAVAASDIMTAANDVFGEVSTLIYR